VQSKPHKQKRNTKYIVAHVTKRSV